MADNTSTAGALDWQTGMNALSQGRAEEAIAMLRPFVAANPNSFEGNNFLGVALSQTGKHDEGIVHLQNATRINSQSATARYNLGLAQQAAGRVESAKKEFQSAIQLDSKHSAAQIALAKIDAGLATPISAPSTPAAVNTPWAEGASAATPQMGAQQAAEIERASKPNVLNVLGGFGAGLVAAILCAVYMG